MNFNHKLMQDNINKSDLLCVKNFLNKKNIILTQNKKVEEFEKKWSKWLGAKYSVYVNSGSSANFISIALLKVINKNKKRNEIIVPTLTWVSDINSIIMNGFKPVFVDIGLKNLSMDTEHVISKINPKLKIKFIKDDFYSKKNIQTSIKKEKRPLATRIIGNEQFSGCLMQPHYFVIISK